MDPIINNPSLSPFIGITGEGGSAQLTRNLYLVIRQDTGKLNGEAYVLFTDAQEANRAETELHQKQIPGNSPEQLATLEVNRTIQGEIYTYLNRAMRETDMGTDGDYRGCVRIRGVPLSARKEEIITLCNNLPIVNITFANRFGALGDCIIEFSNESAAHEALSLLQNCEIQNKRLQDPPKLCYKGEAVAITGGTKNIFTRPDEDAKTVILLTGVPFRIGPDTIREKLHDAGITSSRQICIHQRFDGKPANEGFVICASEADARHAVEVHPRLDLGDRSETICSIVSRKALYDSIQRPVSYEPVPVNSPPSDNVDCVLRCKGMPFDTHENEMEKFFEGFPFVRVIQYGERGKCLEMYVEFPSVNEANIAMCRQKANVSVSSGNRFIDLYPCNLREMNDVLNNKNPRLLGGELVGAVRAGPPSRGRGGYRGGYRGGRGGGGYGGGNDPYAGHGAYGSHGAYGGYSGYGGGYGGGYGADYGSYGGGYPSSYPTGGGATATGGYGGGGANYYGYPGYNYGAYSGYGNYDYTAQGYGGASNPAHTGHHTGATGTNTHPAASSYSTGGGSSSGGGGRTRSRSRERGGSNNPTGGSYDYSNYNAGRQ